MELQDLYTSHGQFIDGAWRPGSESASAMINPATEISLGEVKPAGAAQVTEAIAAAYDARASMRALTAWNRSALLRRAAALINERAEALGRLVALETGKPVRQAVGEAKASAESVDWFADEARRVFGMSYESRVKGDRYLVHMEPLGVVAAFVPWNFPLLLLARKMAPALAAGNTLVIRPSSEAAGATMALIKCFEDAGFPKGAINLVVGRPMEITPTTSPSSNTGRWRIRLSVMSAMQSSLVWSRRTQHTSVVMISLTEVSSDDLPFSATFRA